MIAGQFRPDYLTRSPRPTEGFRRLMEEGVYFPDCRFAGSTFTAPGLATLATGAWPGVHGIVADRWYDRTRRSPVAARPADLLATTLADQVSAQPRSRVFIAALEENEAAFAGGRMAETFFMNSDGLYARRGSQLEWLAAFNKDNSPENYRNAAWRAVGAPPEAPPLRTLRYDASRPRDFLLLYRSSMYGQYTQMQFVRELIVRARLGQADTFDLLVVVLGSIGLLGYEVGGDSLLMQQMVLRLDRELEFTLERLNERVGAGNYGLVFTAAHGAPPEPDVRDRRLEGESVARAIDRAFRDRFAGPVGEASYVEKYVYPFVYLRQDQVRYSLREARALAGRAALTVPGVAGYYTADGDCSHHGDWRRRFENSFHPLRSGDLMLAYLPETVEDFGAGRGISYGSLYNYDARVPLMFHGPPFGAGVLEQPVEAVDVAPTLARAAGAALPSSSTGRVLTAAFAAARPA